MTDWQIGTDKHGKTTVYFVDNEDGYIFYAEDEQEWRDEVKRKFGLVYSDHLAGWYNEDDERAQDNYDMYGNDSQYLWDCIRSQS